MFRSIEPKKKRMYGTSTPFFFFLFEIQFCLRLLNFASKYVLLTLSYSYPYLCNGKYIILYIHAFIDSRSLQ